MKLGTHKDRMAALEAAFDKSSNGMEQAAIVEVAGRMDRENQFSEAEIYRQNQSESRQTRAN